MQHLLEYLANHDFKKDQLTYANCSLAKFVIHDFKKDVVLLYPFTYADCSLAIFVIYMHNLYNIVKNIIVSLSWIITKR